MIYLYWGSIPCLNSKKCAWRGSTVFLKERCGDSDRPSITQGSEVENMNPVEPPIEIINSGNGEPGIAPAVAYCGIPMMRAVANQLVSVVRNMAA